MTTEEKAKAYDNVVNKLKQFMAQGVEPLITRADVQDFFPELNESEDKKMWQLIKKYVHYNISDTVLEVDHITREQLESWIEKQGEQKECELQEVTYHIPKGFHTEIDDDKVVIKKGEKPAAWSEEDENRMKKVMYILSLDGRINNEELKSIYDWLKSLKPQKSAEWSEEDEDNLNLAIYHIRCDDIPYSPHDIEPIVDWLESIKQRMEE